jgi:hypothetical protein
METPVRPDADVLAYLEAYKAGGGVISGTKGYQLASAARRGVPLPSTIAKITDDIEAGGSIYGRLYVRYDSDVRLGDMHSNGEIEGVDVVTYHSGRVRSRRDQDGNWHEVPASGRRQPTR